MVNNNYIDISNLIEISKFIYLLITVKSHIPGVIYKNFAELMKKRHLGFRKFSEIL